MKKNLIRLFIAAALIFSNTAALADKPADETNDENSGIYLQLDSPKMDIGGEITEITAPYLSEEGVTLVPLRVISEAFGAEVEWSEETRSVTVTYNDLTLRLVIGSRAVAVNDHAEELLAAPEIVNGTTMVPVRFIAETFGAKVSFDSETGGILITFPDMVESELLRGMHDKAYVGNSYYGWSMVTPRNMRLANSDDDYLEFYDDYGNSITVDSVKRREPVDANAIYVTMLSDIYGVLTETDKKEDAGGNAVMYVKTDDEGYRRFSKTIVKGNMVMSIELSDSYSGSDDAAEAYDGLAEIVESFSLTQPEDMYDFSSIKGNVREYENEAMKVRFNVPDDYIESYLGNGINEVRFYSENGTDGVATEIYSKNDNMTMDIFAQAEHDVYRDIVNPDFSLSDITDTEINGIPAKVFYAQSSRLDAKYSIVNYYFEIGEYVYNLTINTADENVRNMVADSFKAEELDHDEVGDMLCTRYYLVPYTYSLNGYSLEVPKYWESSYGMVFTDTRSGSMMSASRLSNEEANDIVKSIREIEGENTKTVKAPERIAGTNDYTAVYKLTDEDASAYITIQTKTVGKDVYVFTLLSAEMYFGGAVCDEFYDMIDSFKKTEK